MQRGEDNDQQETCGLRQETDTARRGEKENKNRRHQNRDRGRLLAGVNRALASDEADFITGHELVVDGGLTLRT